MDFLAAMIEQARVRVAEARLRRPLTRPPARPRAEAGATSGQSDRLVAALVAGSRAAADGSVGPALIAEVKRASPSKGAIAPGLDAVSQALAYEAAGADAVSVLTEPSRFGGSLDDLTAITAAVTVPVLRKDFIIDRYQLWEAAAAGAAAVLLIVGALADADLGALLAECRACGLDALVEVHDEAELARGLGAGAALIGVNNRDLRTLSVDLGVTERLAALVPPGVVLVSESGIVTGSDARRVARAGVQALLVGEALVRTPHERLAGLVGELKAQRPLAVDEAERPLSDHERRLTLAADDDAQAAVTRVKICGLTREQDVRLAVAGGAWACGFVFSDSPRRVTPERVARLVREAGNALTVGVVTTESPVWIAHALGVAGLAAVQLSAGADGPTVAAVRAAAMAGGLRPLVIAAADTPDAADADLTLLDARAPGVYGGTGTALDWDALAAGLGASRHDGAAAGFAGGGEPPDRGRLVLAGGLAPRNAGAAIAALHPFALDVASGVELKGAPGVKDPRLLTAFFAAVAVAPAHTDAVASAAPATSATPAPEVNP